MDEDVSDFGQRLPYLIRRVNTALSQRLDRALKPFGLTQAQLSALAILGREHPAGLSGAELAARSGVTPQSMSTAIAGLADRALVTREPRPGHGRIIEVRATDAGRALVHEVQVVTKASEDDFLAGLDEAQHAQLKSLLQLMMRRLDLYLP